MGRAKDESVISAIESAESESDVPTDNGFQEDILGKSTGNDSADAQFGKDHTGSDQQAVKTGR